MKYCLAVDDEPVPYGDGATEADDEVLPQCLLVRRFQLTSLEGTEPPIVWKSSGDRCAIGSHLSNDLVVDAPTVSRFHAEIWLEPRGARVRDLGSRNGVFVDGVRTVDGFLREESLIKLGRAVFRFQFGGEKNRLPLSEATSFGTLCGRSVAMRLVFTVLERAVQSDATVLIEGESGTGKEEAALSLHEQGRRASGPLMVVDCGALPAQLLESELFGHERGAFTGADERRIGVFEQANGGTIFLDEIGELPLELQPKLLRALEAKTIRRLGSERSVPIDVRVIAATYRDLRAEVNGGRFRPDLYFRLAVVKVSLPPLRSRCEDIPDLVARLARHLGAGDEIAAQLGAAEFIAGLQAAAWPGNVRELRNFLERCITLRQPLELAEEPVPSPTAARTPEEDIDPTVPYDEARRRALASFERQYVEALLRRHGGNVSQAARASGIGRVYLHRLMRKHGLKI